MLKPIAFALLATLFLASCTDTPVAPDLGRGGTFYATQAKLDQQGLRTTFVSTSISINLFTEDSVWNSYGGPAFFNGTPLTARSNAGYGTSYFDAYDNPLSLPLKFDGSYHTFIVAGHNSIPAVTDSLPSPTAALTMSYPTITDTISKSKGFTMTWNGVGAMDAHASVSDTNSTIGHRTFAATTADDGSLVISPADLATVDPGPVSVTLHRGNTKTVNTTDGRQYIFNIRSQHTVHTFLKP